MISKKEFQHIVLVQIIGFAIHLVLVHLYPLLLQFLIQVLLFLYPLFPLKGLLSLAYFVLQISDLYL